MRWQSLLVLLVSLLLLAWFLSGVDRHELLRVLVHAHGAWVGVSIASVGVTYTFRAWRWQALLPPISFRHSFRITVMGFTATNLLPGRLGEILRPYLIARVEPVSMAAGLATVVIERLLDLAAIMLLFGVFLATTPVTVGAEVKTAGVLASVVAVLSLGALVFFAGHPETLKRWAEAATGRLPVRMRGAASHFAHKLVDGLRVMRDPRALVRAAFWSLLLWLSIAVTIWSSALALNLTLRFADTFLILMYLVVGVAVPVPSGVGSYHFMYQLAATTVFGIDRDTAAAAAILTHAISFLPISVLGLAYLAQDGWTLARLRGVQSEGGAP